MRDMIEFLALLFALGLLSWLILRKPELTHKTKANRKKK